MRLRFTARSTQDLAAIADHIGAQNPGAAPRVRASILESLQTLALYPRIGRRQTVSGVRKIVTRRYRYLVYYAIHETAGEVAILAIRHPARAREPPEI